MHSLLRTLGILFTFLELDFNDDTMFHFHLLLNVVTLLLVLGLQILCIVATEFGIICAGRHSQGWSTIGSTI